MSTVKKYDIVHKKKKNLHNFSATGRDNTRKLILTICKSFVPVVVLMTRGLARTS